MYDGLFAKCSRYFESLTQILIPFCYKGVVYTYVLIKILLNISFHFPFQHLNPEKCQVFTQKTLILLLEVGNFFFLVLF